MSNRQFSKRTRQYAGATVLAFVVLSAAGVAIADSLVLKSQGSFFVGGRTISTDALTGTSTGFLNTATNTGSITVDQMYVQYQVPEGGDKHVPVVMVHGCCLSAKATRRLRMDAWAGTNISCEKAARCTCPIRFHAHAPDSMRQFTTRSGWARDLPRTCLRFAPRATKLLDAISVRTGDGQSISERAISNRRF